MIDKALSVISNCLTAEVIDKAFKLRTCSDDAVQSVAVGRAAAAGEGLLSAVYRVRVTGRHHTASFVVKGIVADPLLLNTLNCPKYFKREADFFSRVLPVLSELQPSLGAKERLSVNIPICYSSYVDGVNDYILLEDLSESHCRSIGETPSEDEKNRVIRTLAHFHAVSMALRFKNPDKFQEIANSMPELYFSEENRDWYSAYLQNAVDVARRVIAEFEMADSIYYKKFHEFLTEDMYGHQINTVSRRGDHPVLCHGDSWAPNFLQSRERIVMVDFQLVRCASPATDLSYWILMCTDHDTTPRDFQSAVDTYYAALQYYLQDMGVDAARVFTRANLDQELRLFGKYGYLACLTSIPLMTADKCDGSTFIADKFPGQDRVPLERLWNITPIENDEVKLRLRNAVRLALDVGLICFVK